MQMLMTLNMEQRLSLIQNLGLESKFFESFLVKSEALLQKSKYQKGLRLIRSLADEDEYESVLDFLLGLLSPAWDAHIKAYYRGGGLKMGEYTDWELIRDVDKAVAKAIKMLSSLYKTYQAAGWSEGCGWTSYDEFTKSGLKLFIQPKVPAPPVIEKIVNL